MEDDQALVIQRRLGELERVSDWPQWRDNPNLDRSTLRDVGRALALLPQEPSTKQIDILLTVTATDGVSLRQVLPEDVVVEFLGGRDAPYSVQDFLLEFGVDSFFIGSEYARMTGVTGDPEVLIGGTLVAHNNSLERVEDLIALTDAYREVLKIDDESAFRWLAGHSRSCHDFLRLIEKREELTYPENLQKLEDYYASQRYEDGVPEVVVAEGEAEDEESE